MDIAPPSGQDTKRLDRLLHSPLTVRIALLSSLAICWLNVALSSRWTEVPGAVHGARLPWILAALALTTALAARQRVLGPVHMPALARVFLVIGATLLAVAVFRWLPPSDWTRVPFLDNWVPRYRSTIEQIALFREGAVVGWNWSFLGGYQMSSDITQTLAVLAFPLTTLLGPAVGFHCLHVLLFAAVPLLVYADLCGSDDREHAPMAAAFACLLTAGYSFSLVKSGDTNSLAGTVTTTLAIVAAHQAYRGRRWGAPLLAVALALTSWTHLGFFTYAVVFLVLQSLYYRDWAGLVRTGTAVPCAILAVLPLMWENWTYPSYFSFNNVLLHPPDSFQWTEFARRFYYNVEILFLPGRWFNDYSTPVRIFLPVVLLLAARRKGRVGFHAWAALGVVGLLTLNYTEFGFAFARPVHLLPVFTGPVLAGFIGRYAGTRSLAAALALTVGVYVAVVFTRVPHVSELRDWNAALVDQVLESHGAMVLVENSSHPNMDESPGGSSVRTPFPAHFEPLLPVATGRRFYAGYWDGWQWSVFREHLISGGAIWGAPLAAVPQADIERELRRWGVRDVMVWSEPAKRYFSAIATFDRVWSGEPWVRFVYRNADTRAVVTPTGSGELVSYDALSARVRVTNVRTGDLVVVRTNYFPAWSASSDGVAVPLFSMDGQLAFRAPRSGSFEVALAYPKRARLTALALLGLAAGVLLLWKYPGPPRHGTRQSNAGTPSHLPVRGVSTPGATGNPAGRAARTP